MPPRGRYITDEKINFKSLGRLIRYVFSRYGKHLILVAFCLVVSSVSSVIANTFMQKLIDTAIIPGLETGFDSVEGIIFSVIRSMLLIYLFSAVCNYTYTRTMAVVGQGTIKSLRDEMFENMETLPVKYFDSHLNGEIMSTYTNDVDTIRMLVGQTIPSTFQSILSITVVFFTMLRYSVWLTLVVILVISGMLRVVKRFGSRSARFMRARQESLAKEEGFIEEMIEGAKVVKVFTHEQQAKDDFDILNEQLRSDSEIANQTASSLMPILANIGNILYVILAIVGALLAVTKSPNLTITGFNTLSVGVIVSFLSMSRQMSQTINNVSNQVSTIAMALAGSDRVFKLIDEESEKDEGYVMLVNCNIDEEGNITEADHVTGKWAWKHYHKADDTTTYQKLEGDIEMVDVDFAYEKNKQVLYDISLYAKPGQKIAFVGATGAGKTTITNLINRFYDIPDGKIRYDHININKIKKPDLRRSLGMVLQDVNLFTGTVMENIRYGKLDATDEECIEAAKLANAHDFITRLPEGYDTMLTGNGSQLSQGQRQLLSIARAAVANPPVMILDEATSSIDTRTEALVQKGMDNLMEGRTVFVIAHRLSTVRNSNAIMVLDHGRIIERGTHQQLLDLKGTYYQLYTGAFELE